MTPQEVEALLRRSVDVVAPIKLQFTGVFGKYCFTGVSVNPVA
jgi:hypothetical protein